MRKVDAEGRRRKEGRSSFETLLHSETTFGHFETPWDDDSVADWGVRGDDDDDNDGG